MPITASSFGTPQQVIDFVPNRTLDKDGSPETSTDSIQTQLNEVAATVKNFCMRQGIKFPVDGSGNPIAPDPITVTWLVLENLNVIPVAATIIRNISASVQPEIVRYGSALRKLGEERLTVFLAGQLSRGLRAVPALPTTAFATVDDCEVSTPGFNADTVSAPTVALIERWILRETAYVRAMIARFGYRQTNLDIDETSAYRNAVGQVVRAFVLAARGFQQGYNAEIDSHVASLVAASRAEQGNIQRGLYHKLLRKA